MSIKSNQWKEVILENHVNLLTGFPFKSQLFTDNKEDIPLVKGSNVHQGYIDWKDAKRWNFSDFNKYSKFQLEVGDVILAMDRPWIEAGLKYSWIRRNDPPSLLVQRVSRIRGINGLSTSYLRYLIGSSDFTNYIKPIATGINVPHISPDQIRKFKFLLPPLQTQQKIAGILSAYDDLIENNARRIEILEEMARMLYREWFVKLRFPGHEAIPFVESELGLIPEGWEVVTLANILKLTHGYAFKSSQFSTEPTPYVVIRMGNITESGGLQVEKNIKYVEQDSFKEKYLLKPNDLVMAFSDVTRSGGIIGNVALIPNDGNKYILNQRVVKVDLPESLKMFFYIYFNSETFKNHCMSRADSATVLNLKNEHIYEHQVLISSPDILSIFIQNIEPIIKKVQNLEQKNINLRKTRDLLLPRLISGEIDVENLDINTGIQP